VAPGLKRGEKKILGRRKEKKGGKKKVGSSTSRLDNQATMQTSPLFTSTSSTFFGSVGQYGERNRGRKKEKGDPNPQPLSALYLMIMVSTSTTVSLLTP